MLFSSKWIGPYILWDKAKHTTKPSDIIPKIRHSISRDRFLRAAIVENSNESEKVNCYLVWNKFETNVYISDIESSQQIQVVAKNLTQA